jgi:ATP-dependent Clp protease ATP-binding subunit ClpB
MAAVRGHFRPEFLNRVDDIIVFHRLTREDLREIVDIQVERLQRRLDERRITLELGDDARDWLAEHGFDPSFGARPLKRLIERELSDRLAVEVLQGAVRDGDTVRVGAGAEGLTLSA